MKGKRATLTMRPLLLVVVAVAALTAVQALSPHIQPPKHDPVAATQGLIRRRLGDEYVEQVSYQALVYGVVRAVFLLLFLCVDTDNEYAVCVDVLDRAARGGRGARRHGRV